MPKNSYKVYHKSFDENNFKLCLCYKKFFWLKILSYKNFNLYINKYKIFKISFYNSIKLIKFYYITWSNSYNIIYM